MERIKATSISTVTLVVLLAVVLLTACQGQPAAAPTAAPATTAASVATTAAPATSAAAATAASPQTLKIGLSLAPSGPTARNSIMTQRTFQMLVDDVNAKGGLKVGNQSYRIEFVLADDKATAEGGREAGNRLLLAEKVKIIIGSPYPSVCAAIQPLAEQFNALFFSTSGCNSADTLGPKHSTTLTGGLASQEARSGGIIAWVKKAHPQLKSIAILVTEDATGKVEQSGFERAIKENGLNLADTEVFPATTTDFSPIVTRMLAKKPEAVVLGSTPSASQGLSVGIMKALSGQGYNGLVAGAWVNTTAAFLDAVPAALGFVGVGMADHTASAVPAAAKDLGNRFVQKYGQTDYDPSIVLSYSNNPIVLFQALEKAGTVDDAKKIADVLRSNQWDTLYGKYGFGGAKTFGAPSYLETPIFLSKVEGGKWVTFDIQQSPIP